MKAIGPTVYLESAKYRYRDSPDSISQWPNTVAQLAAQGDWVSGRDIDKTISWNFRADIAFEESVHRTFFADEAHFDRLMYLSCRTVWLLLSRGPSWRQRSQLQAVN